MYDFSYGLNRYCRNSYEKLGRFTNPSSKVSHLDTWKGNTHITTRGYYVTEPALTTNANMGQVGLNHGDMANVLWLDGHVAASKLFDIGSHSSATLPDDVLKKWTVD